MPSTPPTPDEARVTPELHAQWLGSLYKVLPAPSLAAAGYAVWQAASPGWAFGIQLVQTLSHVAISAGSTRWPTLEAGGHLRAWLNALGLVGTMVACGPESHAWIVGFVSCLGAVLSPVRITRLYSMSSCILATLTGMVWAGFAPEEIAAAGISLSGVGIISLALFQALMASTQDLERQQQEAVQANGELAAALAARQAFLATMSHEVRTPLNGVLGMTELLTHTRLDAEQQAMLATVKESGVGLLQVLNDILDTAKLDAGAVQLEDIPYSPVSLCDSVVRLLDASTQNKALRLVMEAGSLPEALRGDPARLRQVLLNLVGNAVKFTPKGEVRVLMRWSEDRLHIAVEDTGIGIPAHTLPTLFEPFTQAEVGTTRRFGGTGLGLTICKRLIEQMGGTLHVRSTLGQGSRFFFEIPAPACTERQCTTPEHQGALRASHVLVVDDNPVNRMVAERMLAVLHCSAVSASSGQEALDCMAAERFDLVLMDCRMPGMDGYEATERLRARGVRIPILALTAGVTEAERARCAEAGMDEVLAKPLDIASLRDGMGRWLQADKASA